MAEKKYYVVWKGKTPGIYDSWSECNLQVSGFPGAEFMAFKDKGLAMKAFREPSQRYFAEKKPLFEVSEKDVKSVGLPVYESIAVDAACNMVTRVMEYRGVDARTGKELFRQGPFQGATNNMGEFLAIVHALAMCKQNNLPSMPIYTDSVTALAWLRNKKHKSETERTRENQKVFELLDRAENWLASNTYSNPVKKWETRVWGEIPADFGRK
jgi:ribonuclease HI